MMWYSGDNFEAFVEKYSIENYVDFSEHSGKYIGNQIPVEITLTPWENSPPIFLTAPYNLCFKGSLEDGRLINQQKPHVVNIDGNEIKSEMEDSESAYNVLAKVPLKICQNIGPNLKGKCKESFLIAIGDYSGGSMGWHYEYIIYGLFAFKDNKRFLVPLKRFENKTHATKFLNTLLKE
jgi:hypothetical protein